MHDYDLHALIDDMCEWENLHNSYTEAIAREEKWDIIKKFYESKEEEILLAGERTPMLAAFDIYKLPWTREWDREVGRNEFGLWRSIRPGNIVMYPQYPVLNYFMDFGNPCLKIAIEADSKAWHTREKDMKRDQELHAIGWRTYRLSYQENVDVSYEQLGRIGEMFDKGDYDEALPELKNFMLNTSDGLVEAIVFFYLMSPEEQSWKIDRYPGYLNLAEKTLRMHQHIHSRTLVRVGEEMELRSI